MADIIEIKDIHAPELDIYARLSEGQIAHYFEPAEGLFIAESPMVIGRAMDAGYRPFSMLTEPGIAQGQGCELIARCGDIRVYTAEREVLEQITGYALTRGMLCAMYRKPLPTTEQICREASRIVVLENVMNPTNVGAIFRSAAALNMDGVLLTHGSSDPLYRRAVRVSMGTVFQIPWTFLESNHGVDRNSKKLSELQILRDLGFRTAAMALREDSISLEDSRLLAEEKLAIVLGTEGDGLAADTISECDYTVRIPMSHGVDSLNVAAASAVAFWQLGRRQKIE
ncbi:MAG: RNA methyltransferase [Lachnospiraceae bacterium]|nr:RNA methyltransferase [Lachnospiraceae bacterium]